MNKWTKMAVGTVASVALLAGVVGTSYAADPTPPANATRTWQGGPGTGGATGRGFGYTTMNDALSKLLGMTAEQIHTERLAGKSLVQIALSKGKIESDVVNALLSARKEALDARVKAGAITQAQADSAYKLMQERIKSSVNRTQVGPNPPADGQRMGLGQGAGQGARAGASNGQPGTGRGPGMYNRWGGQAPASR